MECLSYNSENFKTTNVNPFLILSYLTSLFLQSYVHFSSYFTHLSSLFSNFYDSNIIWEITAILPYIHYRSTHFFSSPNISCFPYSKTPQNFVLIIYLYISFRLRIHRHSLINLRCSIKNVENLRIQ